MPKATVFVRRLQTPHQSESLTQFKPLSDELKAEVFAAVEDIFERAGGAALLKSSGEVFIKPNGIDGKAYCHTRPEVVEAAVVYWKNHGAKKIYLFENSTQSNYTRLVFAVSGYDKICKRTGAIPVYLDEDKTVEFEFRGRPDGYTHTKFDMPLFVKENLIDNRDRNLYISLPKLKTHSMAGVTLGVKNQWAFPAQGSRGWDHNYLLADKLADVLGYVRPDFTIIEGVEGTIYGHYPVTALADKVVLPLRVLIGGANVVATDMVGASVFGLTLDDVPHLKIAVERGYSEGVASLADIKIEGDMPRLAKKYPYDLYDCYPDDVRIIKGTERCCKQGCQNNPLTLLQILYNDHHGKGGWTLLMGKGHDPATLESITGRVLVVGECAIAEAGDLLVKRLGRRKVYFSRKCNSLAQSIAAMFHLMKVNPLELAPINPLVTLKCIVLAKLHGSTAMFPNPLSNVIKTV